MNPITPQAEAWLAEFDRIMAIENLDERHRALSQLAQQMVPRRGWRPEPDWAKRAAGERDED